jgi:1-acyl-sn-glycerol-3-phosphate acyltransferase
MIWVRSAAFNALFFLSTAAIGIGALPLLIGPRRYLRGAIRIWAEVVVWLLKTICDVRVEVRGLENLRPGPLVIASKHQSAFDTLIWFTLVPDVTYVLKQELTRIPVYGWHAMALGHISVDRAGGGPALRGMLRQAAESLAKGRQLVIFPEGTRSAPGKPSAYQPGVVAIAGLGVAPVIPVATDSGRVWGRRGFRKFPGTIRISILPELAVKGRRSTLLPALEGVIEAESTRLLAEQNG